MSKEDKSVVVKSNFVKNAITEWKVKYNSKDKKGKIWMVIGTVFLFLCVLRVVVFIFGTPGGSGLPSCGNKKFVEQVSELVRKNIKTEYSTGNVLITNTLETFYDNKAGLRQCEADITYRNDNNVEIGDITYQVAWTNEKEGRYQYKIIDMN